MKKLKKIYNSFSKSMENPRFRSIVILGMYTIFFILIFMMINFGGNATTTLEKESTDTNNNQINKKLNYTNVITQYEYIATIEIDENDIISKYEIVGKNTSNEKSSTSKKYIEETDEYQVIQKPSIVNEEFIDISKVVNYVNELEFEFSTKYKDGTIMKSYLVPIKNINDNITSSEKIEVNIYELNNKINKIIIDSTNYDKYRNNKINSIVYMIEYKEL